MLWGVWMVMHGLGLVQGSPLPSLARLSVLSVHSHNWSHELTEPVLKVLTKRNRYLCDDLWGICGWRGNVEIEVAIVAKCRNRSGWRSSNYYFNIKNSLYIFTLYSGTHFSKPDVNNACSMFGYLILYTWETIDFWAV